MNQTQTKFEYLNIEKIMGFILGNILLVGVGTISLGSYNFLLGGGRVNQTQAQAEERPDRTQAVIEDAQTWCAAHGAKLGKSSMHECIATVKEQWGVK